VTEQQEKPKRPPVAYSTEGKGTIGRCTGCGHEWWRETRVQAERAAPDHKTCLAYMVKLLKRHARRGAR
jgi:hypothetical protein